MFANTVAVTEDVVVVKNMTGHRDKLPCPRPNTEGLSLWSLLRKNIGIDLSRVSMPVALNEPLSMLQVNMSAFKILPTRGQTDVEEELLLE